MTRRHLLEQIGEAAVVQLYADGFAAMPLREKTLVWHLYLAALAGRDIYYDQRYAHHLEMRAVLEVMVTHGQHVDPRVLSEITPRIMRPSHAHDDVVESFAAAQ